MPPAPCGTATPACYVLWGLKITILIGALAHAPFSAPALRYLLQGTYQLANITVIPTSQLPLSTPITPRLDAQSAPPRLLHRRYVCPTIHANYSNIRVALWERLV